MIVILCLIAAMLVPAMPNQAEPVDVTDPVMSVLGQTDAANAGRSIAFLDIDDDGIADLVVGAPGDDSTGLSSGKVMIYLGDEMKSDPDIEITGSAGERFGYAVARAGDVNSDGVDDLIVGAPSNDEGDLDVGAAYIIFGSEDVGSLPTSASGADIVVLGEDTRGQLGYAVSTAGDANLDGVDDVLIGVPLAGAGMVHLLYGDSSMDNTPDKTFTGSNDGDQFGFALVGGLNLDGSAQPDVVVGAPASSSGKGAVRVILNPEKATPKIITLTGDMVGDWFGRSVAVLDYNDDIYGDVAVGAPGASSVGKVYLYYGSASAGKFDKMEDVTFSVGQAGDMFGASVSAGDPRTDGIGDLVVGAPANDTAGVNAGRAYAFYGNETADSEPDVVVEGAEAESWFGLCVAAGINETADYNDDYAADFAVGAPDCGAASQGAAYLYLGIRIVTPEDPTIYGYVLDTVTGEGLNDVLVTLESPAYTRSVRTTSNGSYGLAATVSLPPGTYWINASFDDYFTASEQHALTLDTRTNVSFNLNAMPVIQGVISDGNATGALENALVEVHDDSETLLDSMTTDATGEYHFLLDVEGDVTITVSKEYYFDGVIELTVAGNDDLTEDLTLDHYPILLFTAEDTAGDPIEGVEVSVSIDGVLLETGETDASGGTTIMVPGTGFAYVNSSRVGYVSDSSTVDLLANVIDSLSVAMDQQSSISGTVKDSLFETPVSGATVELFDAGSSDVLDTETTDSYGFYTFAVVEEGAYDLRVTATGYIRQYRPGVDVLKDETATEDFWLVTDSTPPTSEISDPQPGLLCLTAQVNVYANATDPNGNEILDVALYYSHEGKPYMQWGSWDTEAPYMFEFDASETHGDGIYEFYTIARDCAGNQQPAPTTNDTWIVMSSGVPVSEVDALDSYQSTETFTVTVSGSDPFGVQYIELWYSYDGGAFELYDQDDAAPYSWEFTAADGDGEYSFYSILFNDIGQTELPPDEPDASTLLDTTDPTATISSPEDDADIDTGTVELEAEIADVGAGLDYVSYQVGSGDEVVVDLEDGQASYDLAVTLDLEDGEHTIVVTAVDVLDWQFSDDVTFRVDTTDPELTILHPVDGSAVNTLDVEVSWTAEDAVTGVELTEIRMGGGAWETVVGTSKLYADLDDDVYTVDVRVTDGAGNEDTETTTFEVDTIAPTVYITDPEDDDLFMTSTVSVMWEQSDIGSGLDKVEIRIDGGDWELTVTTTTEFTSVSEGSHTVDVMATDLAGNTDTDSVTFDVDVDDTAPIITVTSPEDGELLSVNSVTAEWTVTDGDTGIDTVEYKFDAADWVETTASGSVTLSDLAEGDHTFSVRAEDNAGNSAVVPVQFVVDTLDPTVVITSPTDGATLGTVDVTVEYTTDGTGSAIDVVERSVDGGAWEAAGASSTLVESLDEGVHTVDIRVTDGAGHQATAGVEFTVDVSAPVVMITSPADDALLSTNSVTVEWTVSDSGATVEGSLDGGAWLPATGTSATFTDLSDGEHTVTVRATDGASNEGEDSVTFTVDTTPPTVSITAPEEDAIIDSSSVVITWTATDAVTTERSVDGGTWEAVTGTSVTISPLADGEHTVEIRVTDEADNQASAIVTFTVDTDAPAVDTTPPTVSITSPAGSSSLDTSSVTVTWTASDGTGSGIDTVEVNLDAGAWTTVTGSSNEFAALTEGTHTVSVRVTDNAGNVATAAVTFMVDTVDPSLSITSPEAAWETEDKSVTVTWTCTDTGCGIDRIEVCIDGEAFVSVGTASERVFSDLEAGEHTVDVRAYDEAGNMVEESIVFTVTEDTGISALLIGGIVLAIIVLAAVAVMLMRRKKTPAPPQE